MGSMFLRSAIAAGIGALLVLLGIVLYRHAAREESRPGKIAGATTATAGIVLCCFFAVKWVHAAAGPMFSSAADFFAVFRFHPPADVRDVRGETLVSHGFQSTFFRFRSAPSTIATITANRFATVPLADCQTRFQLKHRPAWWPATLPPTAACYAADPFNSWHDAADQAWLAYDPASGEAAFYYLGID